MQHFNIFITFITSLTLVLIILPALKSIASQLGLVDKPNARKVHIKPIPVIGGLAIGATVVLSTLINPFLVSALTKYFIVIGSALILMIIGVLDDKLNLKASHRLIIQLLAAYAITASGIRITSLYGIFGINELNTFFSYLVSIILITGVVNSFNLIDGIDGLAGFLSIIGLAVFGYNAYRFGDAMLVTIFVTLLGGVIGFLSHNLSNEKVFLGDGGSLFLGFILVVGGIQLIQLADQQPSADVHKTISYVFGVFLIPVLDSLRVYWVRMQNGFSPFRADKTHVHHLFIFFKISHKKTSIIIALLAITFISFILVTVNSYGLSSGILSTSMLFILITSLLSSIKNLNEWKSKVRELEIRD